jgi:hypothetical protein
MRNIFCVIVWFIALVPCKAQVQFALATNNVKEKRAPTPLTPFLSLQPVTFPYKWYNTDLYQIWERLDSICPTAAQSSYLHFTWYNTDLYQIWLKLDSCFGGGGGSVDTNNFWNIHGNSGLNANTNFLGNTDSVAISFRVNDSTRLKLTSWGTLMLSNRGGADYDSLQLNTEQLFAGCQIIGDDSSGYRMVNDGDTARPYNICSVGLYNLHRLRFGYGCNAFGNGVFTYAQGSWGFAGHNPGTPYGYFYECDAFGFLSQHFNQRGQESISMGAKSLYKNIHPNGCVALGVGSLENYVDTLHGDIGIGSFCLQNYLGSGGGSVDVIGTNGCQSLIDGYGICSVGGGNLASALHTISAVVHGEQCLIHATGSGYLAIGDHAGNGVTNANFMKFVGSFCGQNSNLTDWGFYGDGYNLTTQRQDTTQIVWTHKDKQDSSASFSKMNATFGVNDGTNTAGGKRFVLLDASGYGHWSSPGINTTAGDTATINTVSGRFRKDTSGAVFTLTNSFITANSIILLTAANAAIDVTAIGWTVTAGAGSATITFNAAPTANFDMNFLLEN